MRASSATRHRLPAALLAALLGAPAAAAEDARALLAGMAETMRSSAYEGTLVYQQGDSIGAMSLVHGWIDGHEHERLSTLTGQPFELIRAGNSVVCVWPGDKRALVSQRPGEVSPLRALTELTELPSMYEARLAGSERAAGRAARIVEIRARDGLRYGYRMWIDPASHLLLRSDLLATDGSALERILFTDMRPLEQVTRARFEPSLAETDYARHVSAEHSGSELEHPPWVATELPAGFRAVSHVRRSLPPDGQMVQQSVYSDGLASVSVFVEPPGTEASVLEGTSRMGAVHVHGRRVDGHRITVIGEVPGATVRLIAEAVRRRESG